jgi:hypothetical protein
MALISQKEKIDIGLVGRLVSATTAITPAYDMGTYEKALFLVQMGTTALTLGSTSFNLLMRPLQFVNSTDALALGVPIAASSQAQLQLGASSFDTLTGASIITCVQGSSPRAGESFVLNGLTFTYSAAVAASTTDAFTSARLMSASSNLAGNLTRFAAIVNDPTYGCTGLLATATATQVTLIAVPPGDKSITLAINVTAGGSSGSMRAYPTQMQGYIELDTRNVSVSSSYRYVGLEIQPASSFDINVVVLRGEGRYFPGPSTGIPGQAVGSYIQNI